MRKTITIGDLGTVITGKTPPTTNKNYYGDYAVFIKPTDISESSKFTYETEEMYSKVAAEKYSSSLIPKGAICVPCIGTIGTKMTMTHCACFTNQSINSIVCNDKYDNEYVYYLIKNFLPDLKSYNKGTASGREYVSKSSFESIELQAEQDIDVQRKIGQILSRYDALIENYQRQIKLLEEAAQRLYKEWFVDLRFPGHQSTPIINNLPQGWEKKSVNDVLTFHRGYDLTKNSFKNGKYPVVGSTSILGYHSNYKIDGPGIVTGRSGSLGVYQLIWENFWPHNTSLYVSDFKGHDIFFIYCLLNTLDFTTLNSGGAIPSLNRNTLSNIEVLEPSMDLQDAFSRIVKPMFVKQRNLSTQIRTLSEARDRLLPKLMSAEIDV